MEQILDEKMKARLESLEEMFDWWPAAVDLDLEFLGKGWAKAEFPIFAKYWTIDSVPMVFEKEIESAAAKIGLMAASTLTNENECVVYSHDARSSTPNCLEETVPDEKFLVMVATVTNDKTAKHDQISVRVIVKNARDRIKAEYDFFYRVEPREKMEQKLLKLAELAK